MSVAANTVAVETGHEEMIHDAQLDYYGKRLATASSDRTVRVFEVVGTQNKLLAELTGHDGPVWQVAWSHPQYGNLLASCSYDRRVCIWKEEGTQFIKIFEDQSHDASVSSVSWAPHQTGLHLAAGSADGTITVFTYKQDAKSWIKSRFPAHKGGVNAVSWAPAVAPGDLISGQPPVNTAPRFVSGGCDNRIRIWTPNEQTGVWTEAKVFEQNEQSHSDWVRDVAWAPGIGLPTSTIASCSEDKTVIVWTEEKNGTWKKRKVLEFDHKVWRVSWSTMGNILAVSQGDNTVSLWKESIDGKWEKLSSMDEQQSQAQEESKAAQ